MSKDFARVSTPFRYEYLALMDIREPERVLVEGTPDRYRALAVVGDGGILLHNGVILAAFGFLPLWEGVYEVWVIPTIHISRHPRVFLRTVRCYVDRFFEAHPVRRIQSPALDDAFHSKWMRHLGFKNETPQGMKNYLGGETYNLWARCE